MNNKVSFFCSELRRIIHGVLLICAGISISAYGAYPEFAAIPLYLQNKTNVSASITPLTNSAGIPDMVAIVHLNTESWSSQLHFYSVNKEGKVNLSSYAQPSFVNRKFLINDGSKVSWLTTLQKDEKTNADFGISGGMPQDDYEWHSVLVPWTARKNDDQSLSILAKNNGYSQTYRLREKGGRDLGDILGTVATIGQTTNGRQEFMVAAANDGMVHLFKNSTATPYDLKLSYIPAGMDREDDEGHASNMGKYLKDIANAEYGTSTVPHRYMVNGGFVLRRTSVGGKGQQSFMFGSMGRGGRGAYALTLGGKNRVTGKLIGLDTNESQWSVEVPLFETTKGASNALGYTIGSPQIGRIATKRINNIPETTDTGIRYAGFLSSGYRGQEDSETALYIYDILGQDAQTGETNGNTPGTLIKKIVVADGVGGLSEPTLVDTDYDGVVDVVYAGDYGGNMYRFDLRGNSPNTWNAKMIYRGNTSQPITSAPAISRRGVNKYVVIFGTGSDLYQSDLANQDQQAVYGIYDDLTEEPSQATVSDLQVQTMSIHSGNIYVSNQKVDEDKKGWYVNLVAGKGERVVVKPTMILKTAVVSTRIYKSNTSEMNGDIDLSKIKVESSSSVIGLNAENGGSLNARSARFTDKSTAHSVDGVTYYANGLVRSGIVNFAYTDAAKLTDSPVTADGASGSTGTDPELNKAGVGNIPTNKCFSKSAIRVLLTNQGESFDVSGRVCGLQRLSWRGIFF